MEDMEAMVLAMPQLAMQDLAMEDLAMEVLVMEVLVMEVLAMEVLAMEDMEAMVLDMHQQLWHMCVLLGGALEAQGQRVRVPSGEQERSKLLNKHTSLLITGEYRHTNNVFLEFLFYLMIILFPAIMEPMAVPMLHQDMESVEDIPMLIMDQQPMVLMVQWEHPMLEELVQDMLVLDMVQGLEELVP